MKQDELDKAIKLWQEYYMWCDGFDNFYCSGHLDRDGYSKMPANMDEFISVNKNARRTLEALFEGCDMRSEIIQKAKELCQISRKRNKV